MSPLVHPPDALIDYPGATLAAGGSTPVFDVTGWPSVIVSATLNTSLATQLLVVWSSRLAPASVGGLATDRFWLGPFAGMTVNVIYPCRGPFVQVEAATSSLWKIIVRPCALQVTSPLVIPSDPTVPLINNGATGTVLGANGSATFESQQPWIGRAHVWAFSTVAGATVDLYTVGASSRFLAGILKANVAAGTDINLDVPIPPTRLQALLGAPAAGATIFLAVTPYLGG